MSNEGIKGNNGKEVRENGEWNTEHGTGKTEQGTGKMENIHRARDVLPPTGGIPCLAYQ